MVFLGKIKKLAQKLQSGAFLALLTLFFIFPASGLMADVLDLPVIIPNDELLTPIELRDGLVYEVVVTPETEIVANDSMFLENKSVVLLNPSPTLDLGEQADSSLKTEGVILFPNGNVLLINAERNLRQRNLDFERGPEHFFVKSIASPGLFGFLGICLSRSELPSKNFSTPCENSLQKSMTRRSANDWKFLWQPVRMTSLWRMSISSSRMQKTSIPRPSQSHTPSMSDTSSTWSNAMAEYPVIYCLEKTTEPPTALVQSPLKSINLQMAQKANNPPQNPQLL